MGVGPGRPRLGGGARLPVRGRAAALAILLLTGAPATSAGETLQQALASAYRNNPKLDAERARLRATDEEVPRAMSGWRPNVEASADYGWQRATIVPNSDIAGDTLPRSYGIGVTQQLFNGFRTDNAVREAEATVRAGREILRLAETQVLLDAATAFMDVVRDQVIVKLRESNADVLNRELAAALVRRAAREVTRTDVAQAQARRARAGSQLDLARANLRTSRATFERVVGHQPSGLREPSSRLLVLPPSMEEAQRIAGRESPNVVSALYREQAARHAVDRIWGELLPEVRVEAAYSHRGEPTRRIEEQDALSVTGRLLVPLYKGGETHAKVRQSKHTHVSRLQEIEQARSESVANAAAAWSRLQAANAQVKSDQVEVAANEIALEGVREEQKVGQRTLIDVLNAEQELLDAKVQQVSTRRDMVVAAFSLQAFIGRLTAETLKLGSDIYEPEAYYVEVRRKWFGLAITHADGRLELWDAAEVKDPSPVVTHAVPAAPAAPEPSEEPYPAMRSRTFQ